MITCHSEYGAIKTVMLKRAGDAFLSEGLVLKQWRDLNFLEAPRFDDSKRQYESFEKAVTKGGAKAIFLPKDETLSIDSIYCRDASLTTDFGAIICNMGKATRAGEPLAEQNTFASNGVGILGVIKSPGTLEGGDCAWIDQHILAVGHTYRTNEEGIRQLKALLEPKGVAVVVVPLPHYKGPSDVFHLMSILSPIDKDLAVVYSPLMPIAFRNELMACGYSFVEVPDSEFDSMGCNVLAIGPRECLVVDGNPITKARLEAAGCKVITYQGSEISVKGGGGPTCLTRPIEREI